MLDYCESYYIKTLDGKYMSDVYTVNGLDFETDNVLCAKVFKTFRDAEAYFKKENLSDKYVYVDKTGYTYDVFFNSENASNNKGFADPVLECVNYIDWYNGSNESYFKDYKGGLVSIVCNQTGEVVYEERIK